MKCPKCHSDNPETAAFCADCGTKLSLPKDVDVTKTLETPEDELTTGSTFAGRYQIIEELGKGGMGKVYKVLDKEVNAKIALKLIIPEIAADKKTIERFRNELKTARDISHKNICRMYDLNKEESSYYITMEYVPGENLKSFIRRSRQLTVGTAILIAKQVCEGLVEAHRLGVVHRDLKPSNVMVDKEGNARIMDFGIARSLKAKGITDAGVMIGTPEYMSPEQAEVKEVDQCSDIYSLGVILYEMVTGRVPFEGETALGIAMKHRSEEPLDPRKINAQIPGTLSRVILRCLEKDKKNRYQSAGELRSELERVEMGIPKTEKVIPKRKPITAREITVTFGLKKLFIPALVLVAVVMIAVIIWQLLPQKEVVPVESDKPSLAIMYFKNNTRDENLEYLRDSLSDLLITNLTQSKYIRVISGDMLFSILVQLNLLEAERYSSEDLKEVANRGKATHILQGNYIKVGETLRVSIEIQEASTMELLASDSIDGKEETLLSMVDELTMRIKSNLEVSDEEIAGDTYGDITTSSQEAYKSFALGVKHHEKGEYDKAILCYKGAIALDSKFAMAYQKLAMVYETLGDETEMLKYFEKFLELSN